MCRASAPPCAARVRAALIAAVIAAAALVSVAPAAAQTPQAGPATTIDGPSADISGLTSFSLARDGLGALVYLKAVGGVPHVFASRLVSGAFQPPEQVDAGLAGPSSQPVVAAGNGGLVLIAFVNTGQLYVVDRLGAGSPATAPIPLTGGGVTNPSISMSNFGKAYLSFTETGQGGHDVRVAYYANGIWGLQAGALDANPADDAGTGTGRSEVATAGDGVGIVAWGENGHVYTRRVRGAAASVVFEQADVPSVNGFSAVSADLPTVASGGNSSYAGVGFRETVASGVQQQSRVMMRRLHGSIFEDPVFIDGLGTPGTTNATAPAAVATEYGRGFVTSVRDDNQVWTTTLRGNDLAGSITRVDSLGDASQPIAVPGLAGLFSDFIAWQRDPGPFGSPEIRVRYADGGTALGSETVLSTPDLGPADGARGLVAAGDVSGDAAVAWIQGTGSDTRIMAAQMYIAPGTPVPATTFSYARTRQPLLGWSPARAQWGPITYAVYVDGMPLPALTGLSVRPPLPMPDGPHTWQVTATNPVGAQKSSLTATVWVDAVPPAVRLSLSGRRRVASELHATASATDAPPPEPRNAASGIADVFINWGDGARFHITRGKYHAYKRAGRYTIRVVVADRAGNRTTAKQTIRIAPKPKPKPKKKKKPKPTKKKTTLQHGSRR
jgi:hypothetical protein